MADKPNTQIIIRHIAGAKVNKIDPFALADTKEISFGREAGSTIVFDAPKDDVVSRKHAVLRIKSNGTLSFSIEDLNSSNGTFVNGQKITGAAELVPEDTVEFGKGGPKFTFDVQPRPDNMAARTRVMSAIDTTATRAVATTAMTATPTGQTATPPAKAGIGKNTVMMMLSDERKKTSQVWMGAMAAVLAFVIVGGGALYWRMQQEAEAQAAKASAEATSAATQQINAVTTSMGMTPGEIANKYGNSTVMIEMQWRLYDKETGRPVFHKAWSEQINKKDVTLPAYLKLPNGNVVPWLTTEDEQHRNIEIRGAGRGSGFVVSPQGYILTNKHVGASWRQSVSPASYAGTTNGFLLSKDPKGKVVYEVIDVAKVAPRVLSWSPEDDGGFLFNSALQKSGRNIDLPELSQKTTLKTFNGRNEVLTVRFPHSRLSINADLTSSSTDEDVALLKINSPEPLVPLELATDDEVKIGEKVIVLGYPAVSAETIMTIENDRTGRKSQEIIPEVTVTDGIVQRLGMATAQEGTRRIEGSLGDTIQLSVLSSAGNSGGPVFNASGKVVGLFTFGHTYGDTTVNYAVRIRHGRNLLKPQLVQ